MKLELIDLYLMMLENIEYQEKERQPKKVVIDQDQINRMTTPLPWRTTPMPIITTTPTWIYTNDGTSQPFIGGNWSTGSSGGTCDAYVSNISNVGQTISGTMTMQLIQPLESVTLTADITDEQRQSISDMFEELRNEPAVLTAVRG